MLIENVEQITQEDIEQLLKECIDELREKDWELLEHDVSERSITHKLAEYLQQRTTLNVDCEYNRNSENGMFFQKIIYQLKYNTRQQARRIRTSNMEELIAISTFPDIIVHRRTKNDENLLIVEVKKENSQVNHTHDHDKLKAFTEKTDANSYGFRYGVFLLLTTGSEWVNEPKLTWFVGGDEMKNDY